MAKNNFLATLLGKKTAAKVSSGKQTKSQALAKKYEKESKKISKATGDNGTSTKNTGSRQQNDGTEIRKTKTGTDNPSPQIPNTSPQKVTNVYKKGGTVTTLGLGAVLGGVGTWLSGIAQQAAAVIPGEDPAIPEEFAPDETTGDSEWWDDMNTEAAGLLEGASDIPILGDITEAAEEGGWSFPLIIGIVVLFIGAAALIYKKAVKNKKPAAKKSRKTTAKKPRSTKK